MDLTHEHVPAKTYDVAAMVFGHVPKSDQAFFINNMIQAVKPDGYVLFEVYSEAQLSYKTGGPPVIENLYNPVDLLKIIEPYQCLHFYYGEVERHEGTGHTGLGHVIQVVLKK